MSIFEEIEAMLESRLSRIRDTEHTHCCGFSLDQSEGPSGCGHKWTHKMSDFDDQESFDEGHYCPKCGKGPWHWHLNEGTLEEHRQKQELAW
jgi:hypothetical protein